MLPGHLQTCFFWDPTQVAQGQILTSSVADELYGNSVDFGKRGPQCLMARDEHLKGFLEYTRIQRALQPICPTHITRRFGKLTKESPIHELG